MQHLRFAPIACVATFAIACAIPANGTGEWLTAPSGSSSTGGGNGSDPGGGSTLPSNDTEDADAASPNGGGSADASANTGEAGDPGNGGGSSDASAPAFDAAPGATSDAAGPGSPYKGVALYEEGTCPDVATLGLSWYYNWTVTTHCQTNAQYVPQIWGHPYEPIASEIATMVSGGSRVVLGFNEPDSMSQSNMTVAQAVMQWPNLDVPSLRLGSPATSSTSAGQTWMTQFMTQAAQENLRVDFVAIHWTGQGASACADAATLEGYIRWAEQWQKPIWLTEWSCTTSTAAPGTYWGPPPAPTDQDSATIKAFYDAALAMFANHPLLERYAWYLSRGTDDTALIDTTTGMPTPLGTDYAAAPATH